MTVQDVFGKHMNNPALTKLPVSLFEDLAPGGALCHIMATAFRVKTEQSWRRFDFHSPSRIDRGIELFMSIHKELTQVWWLHLRGDVTSVRVHSLSASIERSDTVGLKFFQR